MIARPRGVTLTLTTFFASVATAAIVLAGPETGPLPAVARDKIAPWVFAHATANQDAEFIVVLADQADLSPAAQLRGKLAKGRFVRDALYAKAQSTQAPLIAWLEQRRLTYQSFYIVNAVLVRGTIPVAVEIAERSDVARIDGNPVITNLTPVTPTPEEIEAAARQLESPQAIEPGVSSIRAPEVWTDGFTGQGIVIGGADTGVRWDHDALKDHYRGWDGTTVNHDFNWHDSVHSGGGSCGPNSFVACDDNGHGTHTIGTVVGADATNTNQVGVAPGAKFIACRNMDQGDGTPATYIECMEWFLAPYPLGGTPAQGDPDQAPDLTTNSWGCPASEGCGPATLQQAVEAQRAAGIMFVGAAGNDGSVCSTVSDPPSIYDATCTVGAYDVSTGNIADFSSRGPVLADASNRMKPDISAPGVSVRSSTRTSTSSYGSSSGTSMAAPHVAGAIALLWSARPSLRNQIGPTEDVFDQSAVDVTSTSCASSGVPNNVYGWGRLDIKAAVDLATVAVDPGAPVVPSTRSVWLAPIQPNPGRRVTVVRFRLEHEGNVDLQILSASGRRIRTLVHGRRSAGEHVLGWDGLNDRGETSPAGVYFVQLVSRGKTASSKMIWLAR